MDTIKTIYENLTLEELKQAVIEIAEQNESGDLLDRVVRKILGQVREITKDSHFPLASVENSITWEVCKRWYNGTYGSREGEIKE